MFSLIHPQHGYYVSFPLGGGYYDQPFRLMQILNALREGYIERLSEQMKKAMKKR